MGTMSTEELREALRSAYRSLDKASNTIIDLETDAHQVQQQQPLRVL